MIPLIKEFREKKLVGMDMTMSLLQNKTPDLWKSFMPRRKEILNTIGTELYSIQCYDSKYFSHFNPANTFKKMAAVEVSSVENLPDNMISITLESGLYAVFQYKGPANEGAKVFHYILNEWLPQSAYHLDIRPHFEILGKKYSNTSPLSEEEIWIPIQLK